MRKLRNSRPRATEGQQARKEPGPQGGWKNLIPAVPGETARSGLARAGVSQSPLFIPSVVRGFSPARVWRKMLTNWGMPGGDTQDDIRSNPRRDNCRNRVLKLREKGPGVRGYRQGEVCLLLTLSTPRQKGKLILCQSGSGEGARGGRRRAPFSPAEEGTL